MLQSRHWWLHSSGDLVYSLCSLLTYSFYLISFDQIIVLQMLQLYVKYNDTIPYHNSDRTRHLNIVNKLEYGNYNINIP